MDRRGFLRKISIGIVVAPIVATGIKQLEPEKKKINAGDALCKVKADTSQLDDLYFCNVPMHMNKLNVQAVITSKSIKNMGIAMAATSESGKALRDAINNSIYDYQYISPYITVSGKYA